MTVQIGDVTWYVDWYHNRDPKVARWDKRQKQVVPCNGATLCQISTEPIRNLRTPHNTVSGSTICSKQDNFNKARGRKLSLARALRGNFQRGERALFWNAYLKGMV